MATVQKIRCQVERITDYGGHVYTVDLHPTERLPRFRPGQFLHLALDPYDASTFWPESRVFSIASSPIQRDHLQIAYAVQGRFTARMEQELAVGKRVWVKLPYGQFVIEDARDIVLVAGGTGVTAFTAFIAGLTPGYGNDIHLFYGARNPKLLIYQELVRKRADTIPHFHPRYYVEQSPGSDDLISPDIQVGRLSIATVWENVPAPSQQHFYLSGPPPMLKAFSHDLRERGSSPEAIRIDAWE